MMARQRILMLFPILGSLGEKFYFFKIGFSGLFLFIWTIEQMFILGLFGKKYMWPHIYKNPRGKNDEGNLDNHTE